MEHKIDLRKSPMYADRDSSVANNEPTDTSKSITAPAKKTIKATPNFRKSPMFLQYSPAGEPATAPQSKPKKQQKRPDLRKSPMHVAHNNLLAPPN